MKTIVFLTLSILFISEVNSQKFWLTTYGFPGGPKTCITMVDDTVLVAGTENMVIKSADDGYSWDTLLQASTIFSLVYTKEKTLLVGGMGEIFYSDDFGMTWDSVSLQTEYPVKKIIQNNTGNLFAMTGGINYFEIYDGDGVFFSDDHGQTWEQRNNGLGSYQNVEHLVIDKNGRLYLTVEDLNTSGNGGLYISENEGELWEHFDIEYLGEDHESGKVRVEYVTGLSISPDDTVYLSLSGVAGNFNVTLNLKKSISDIKNNSYWLYFGITEPVNWWNDKLLNNIHFAKNGDRYSSISGTINVGGTFFQKYPGITWNRHTQGLGIDTWGFQSSQQFIENDTGKIYMIQFLDERIYWADTSVMKTVQIKNPVSENAFYYMYPNPVKTNSSFVVENKITDKETLAILFDSSGKLILKETFTGQMIISTSQLKGLHILRLQSDKTTEHHKVVVY